MQREKEPRSSDTIVASIAFLGFDEHGQIVPANSTSLYRPSGESDEEIMRWFIESTLSRYHLGWEYADRVHVRFFKHKKEQTKLPQFAVSATAMRGSDYLLQDLQIYTGPNPQDVLRQAMANYRGHWSGCRDLVVTVYPL